MFKRLIFLFCLPVLFLQSNEKYSIAPPPEWVKPCGFSLEAIPIKPRQEHNQIFLMDVQKNWEEKTTYIHKVSKVVDQIGIDEFSQIKFNFDPSYQQMVVHQIRIYRDGQWSDRKETSRRELLQREQNLEGGIFNGGLTLVYFLNDIRIGDILEYSCSFVGEHPTFSSHFGTIIYLEDLEVFEKMYYRILMHPAQALPMKFFNTSHQPIITDISPTLREYVWETSNTALACDDHDQPSWYQPEAHIQISQYNTWQELALELVPLYALASDFFDNPSSEMVALVESWKAVSEDPSERALLALRFVQDKVRYLGFEDGIGSIVPRDPRVILERRYGDCKDKSVLLRTLLNFMDISAHPVLVHSRKGKRLREMLPSPIVFNHVVLQIEIDGKSYYVDPTISLQGGKLQDNYFPSYHWGLVLSDKTTDLVQLPTFSQLPIEIDQEITITSLTSADLKVTEISYGGHADRVRGNLQARGIINLRKDLLDNVQDRYKGASVISPATITDDREKNAYTITYSYKIPTRHRSGKQTLKIYSTILEEGVDETINLERTSAFALVYPHHLKERIHVKNPFNNWPSDSENSTFENESVFYTFLMKKEGYSVDYTIELKHLKDHVPLNAVQDYWNIIHEIAPNPALKLIISAPEGLALGV